MWLVGHTPDAWEPSRTVFLYKKGDPHCMQNWRPIALANTLYSIKPQFDSRASGTAFELFRMLSSESVQQFFRLEITHTELLRRISQIWLPVVYKSIKLYKTWTSMVTRVLSTYEERQGIIGSAQEGFCKHRNTMKQLQMAILMIEDAALYRQDLYSLYIDFSSAFNTVNHDQLPMIMHKMGLPDVATNTVKDIYTNACTKLWCKVFMPSGVTEDISIGRGTIQGDTLSPYLFLIFIEPLLRWLQHGGRGYAPGCLADTQHPKTVAALAYADDLKTLTGTLSNMKLQAEKIQRFSKWSGMEVNAKKCAATATAVTAWTGKCRPRQEPGQ